MGFSKIKIGDRFGDLTVVEDTKKRAKDGSVIWRCKCSCGNTNYETVSSELRRQPPRNKTHCNDSIHQIRDISGEIYGEVKVLSLSEIRSHKSYFNCQCLRCGQFFEARGNDILSGKTQTCGCGKSFSRGAIKIKTLLQENNLPFDTEISFSDCCTEKNNPMYFDFGVYDTNKQNLLYLIEYDGEQHFYYINGDKTWNTEDRYKITQLRDKIKNRWCYDHNIPLIRIPYIDIDIIEIKDLELKTSSYIVKA